MNPEAKVFTMFFLPLVALIAVFPHIFVWGSCCWFCIPPSVRLPPPVVPSSQLAHSQFVHAQLVHNLSTHNLLSYSLSSYIWSSHNLLTNNHLSTHNLLTYTLSSHIVSSHNLSSHNLLTNNLSTHNLLTYALSSYILSSHNLLTNNFFGVAGVALGDIYLHFAWQAHTTCSQTSLLAWQAWHLATSTFTLRGRRGTHGIGLALVARLVLGVMRWRRGVLRGRLTLRGVALGDIHRHFAWQAWHAWHWAGSGGALGFTCDAAAFCVAGVALGDIHLHFAWQAWHLVTSTVTLRGRRGTHGIGLALVARLVLGVTPWRRGVLRGRRGTWRYPPSLCVAGVALGDIHRHFAWQAWHAWLGWLWWRAWF